MSTNDISELAEFLEEHFPPTSLNPVKYAIRLLAESNGIELPREKSKWSGTICYNKGMGVQYFNVQEIFAFTHDEAKEALKVVATEKFPDQWMDLRVRPTLP
jgi:hypothetical protein